MLASTLCIPPKCSIMLDPLSSSSTSKATHFITKGSGLLLSAINSNAFCLVDFCSFLLPSPPLDAAALAVFGLFDVVVVAGGFAALVVAVASKRT